MGARILPFPIRKCADSEALRKCVLQLREHIATFDIVLNSSNIHASEEVLDGWHKQLQLAIQDLHKAESLLASNVTQV
jgi:hypothetical protein